MSNKEKIKQFMALGVDPADVVTLVLAWHLKCENMCEFGREGWIAGWTALGCDSIDKMKSSLAVMRSELDDPAKFKQIYQYTFNFAKQTGQKSLDLETAVAFWGLLLSGRYKFLDDWTEFLTTNHKKAISKDTWNLFLDFVNAFKDDFSSHEDDGAWPVLIDDFVTYMKEKEQ
ncbi:Cullin binding-domain-containing protein [Zopfochytrium polystomum]|nr:Cullin binding-domain-containing protein [Zopfochytrium polystomum]